MTLTHYHPTVTHDPFEHQMKREFVIGSGIQPTLYQAATSLVEDTELFAGGEVHYPIHEALNWHLTRFGRQARQTLQAVLLCHEDGSTWQAKLSAPRTDARGKAQKYETPVAMVPGPICRQSHPPSGNASASATGLTCP
jgi:hypothetical protein